MIIISSAYFFPMLGLFIMAVLIYANNRLINETIAWMEKEEELLARRSFAKYYLMKAVRLVCVFIFYVSGKEVKETIKCWRENGKISF